MVWSCGLSVDCAWLHLCRSYARLYERHALPSQRRRWSARACGQVSWQSHKEGKPCVHRVAANDGGRGLCVQSGNHSSRHRRFRDDVDSYHFYLLHHCHHATHRQDHRQGLSAFRLLSLVHGCGADDRSVCEDAAAARTVERPQQE